MTKKELKEQLKYKIFLNDVEIKPATKFKLKRNIFQIIKDKIEFMKNKRKQKGSIKFTLYLKKS